MTRRVAHVLGRSSGGIRRVVRYLSENPPPGYETAGVVGPAGLAEHFDDLSFAALEGFRPWARLGPDVVHAHGFTAAVHVVVSERGAHLTRFVSSRGKNRTPRLPVVATVHTAPSQTLRADATGSRLAWPQKALWRTGRIFAEKADALIAVSEEVARGLKGAVVIPPAIDLPAASEPRSRVRETLGTPRERVVVLAVGRLHPDKALDLFIEAVAGTGAEGWIAGEGPDRAKLEALAAGTPVRILGQRSDVGSLMAAADVFALPAAGEAYGVAVLEALAAGLPTVATRTGAIPEIAGEAAVLVDPADRRAFVRETRRLIADPDARAALANKARHRPLPSPIDLVARVGSVYDKVCSEIRGRFPTADEKMS